MTKRYELIPTGAVIATVVGLIRQSGFVQISSNPGKTSYYFARSRERNQFQLRISDHPMSWHGQRQNPQIVCSQVVGPMQRTADIASLVQHITTTFDRECARRLARM